MIYLDVNFMAAAKPKDAVEPPRWQLTLSPRQNTFASNSEQRTPRCLTPAKAQTPSFEPEFQKKNEAELVRWQLTLSPRHKIVTSNSEMDIPPVVVSKTPATRLTPSIEPASNRAAEMRRSMVPKVSSLRWSLLDATQLAWCLVIVCYGVPSN